LKKFFFSGKGELSFDEGPASFICSLSSLATAEEGGGRKIPFPIRAIKRGKKKKKFAHRLDGVFHSFFLKVYPTKKTGGEERGKGEKV